MLQKIMQNAQGTYWKIVTVRLLNKKMEEFTYSNKNDQKKIWKRRRIDEVHGESSDGQGTQWNSFTVRK